MNTDAIHIASYLMLAATLCNAGALLWLQLHAYSKHHHKSFLILTLSTITALLSFFAVTIPAFLPAVRPWYTFIYLSSAVLYILYAALGIWGVSLLFRSYGALKQGA
ncbi:hypothetical protein GCM10007862_13780 [Dyella lipolytica]|uniref:Uncharacterized protein n=1 Tax=Dyella lipolytica TaxID=1867835 RepID=A0ABW8IWU8_9GAMM|nr:hypothetical protein [Dyella lipolytica]GLQ46327.1 hypothetical protein GCM10007862_13780 [Dyella lipolytica]